MPKGIYKRKIYRDPNWMVDYTIRKDKESGKFIKQIIDTDLNKFLKMKNKNQTKENWEKEFEKEFDMYNPIHDDGTKIPIWSGSDFENIKSFIRQLLIQEKEKLIHDHKILVNTILEKKKQEREKLLERIENLEKENKEFEENGLNPMKKSVWKLKKVCGNCGKPFVPDKEAMIFGTKKWDGHTFRFGCKCLKNKSIRISIG